MRVGMDEDIKRWMARRKTTLVMETIQNKTTVSEVSRQSDLTPSAIEEWVDQGKAVMENALEKSCSPCREEIGHDRVNPAGSSSR